MTIYKTIGLSFLLLLAVFPAQAVPVFTVSSPSQNASVPSGTVGVQFLAQGFTLGGVGQTHLHLYLDTDPETYHFYNGTTKEVWWMGAHTHTIHWKSTTSIEIYGLSSTLHQVRFVLANADHSELGNPEATRTLNFTVLTPPAARFTLQAVASPVNFPVGMAFAPDGRLFYNEWGTGKVRVMDPGWSLRPQAFWQVSDLITGGSEQGMLGITVDPDFTNNHFVYIYYDAAGSPNRCRVLRLTDVGSVGTNPTYIVDNIPEGPIHNSGSLNFGPDGKLYITTGDAANGVETEYESDVVNNSESQNPNALNGKVLRVNRDGTIPPDNPNPASPVWAMGLRNTFGAAFHPDTGDLWSTENGPEDNDEINRLVRNGNYGWPNVRGIVNNPAYIDPLVAYTPTIAPTGILALRPNSVYPAEYQYNLFHNDWKGGKIRRIILTGPGQRQLGSVSVAYNGGAGGLAAIVQGPDGYIYVASTSTIYRMVYSSNQAPSAVSVSPASGTGTTQTFSFVYSDPNGGADLPAAEMLINGSLTMASACYLHYDRVLNKISLRNDNDSAWLGPVTLGSGTTLENTQCRVNTSTSSASTATNLTVNLDLTFKAAFNGLKQIYMQTTDMGGLATGWQQRGSWTVGSGGGGGGGGTQAPSAVSVTPASGTGMAQSFSFLYSDPNGYADLPWVEMLVKNSLSLSTACYLRYDRVLNKVSIRDSSNSGWLTAVTLGSNATSENAQCKVNGATSSVIPSGNNLAVILDLTFKSTYTGVKQIYMRTQDVGGLATGWQQRGTWTVGAGGGGGGSNQPPSAISVTPASGTGASQSFSFLYSDPNGFSDLPAVEMLINSSVALNNACYLRYDRGLNNVSLRNDSNTGWLTPLALGTNTTSENAQCKIKAATSSASPSGNNLTVTLDLDFKPAFTGPKQVNMQTQDLGGLATGWQQRGSWTVGGPAVNQAPSAVSVTPAAASGASQLFNFLYSDPNGATDLPWAQVVINGSLNAVDGCYIHYDRSTNGISLLNDAATVWQPFVSLGSGATTENSQCKVNGATSSASSVGTNLTLNLDLIRKPAFGGLKQIYMQTQDTGNLATGWQQRGTWTIVGPPGPPTAVSVTPSSGTGASQVFSFLYSDPAGATDLPWAQMVINGSLNAANGCYVHYDRTYNAVFLLNDDATVWLGSVDLGTATTLENSQCQLNAATSAASSVGSNLTVNLDLTFKPAFSGPKSVYMQTQDTGGTATGWQLRGTWTVP